MKYNVKYAFPWTIPGILIFLTISMTGYSQEAKIDSIRYGNENHACFKCHGQNKYFYFSQLTKKMVKDRMNPYYIIDSSEFYVSNHRAFKCTDCHAVEYEGNFPHPGNLRMEMSYTCMDCHEDDPVTAKFNFEMINDEFQKSVHSTKHDEDFTCWMCHNPHTYKINARSNESIHNVIAYDNQICLSCHSNIDKYQLLTNKENPNLIKKHDWLPNQKLHFMEVRCIECHAKYNNDILVAHDILPKDSAVRKCVECHQKNSLLVATLYKYQVMENRRKNLAGQEDNNLSDPHVKDLSVGALYNNQDLKGRRKSLAAGQGKNSLPDSQVQAGGIRHKNGYFNAIILNDAYIIGANRNYYLNIISVVIFSLVLGGILFHSILRFRK
jgi:hypothetical protein